VVIGSLPYIPQDDTYMVMFRLHHPETGEYRSYELNPLPVDMVDLAEALRKDVLSQWYLIDDNSQSFASQRRNRPSRRRVFKKRNLFSGQGLPVLQRGFVYSVQQYAI
jgi:hypothetical protein